jgi:hypothetical protein
MRDFINDQKTGHCVAYIDSGDVYNRQNIKIAIVKHGNTVPRALEWLDTAVELHQG